LIGGGKSAVNINGCRFIMADFNHYIAVVVAENMNGLRLDFL
jgi:hypothetical protein